MLAELGLGYPEQKYLTQQEAPTIVRPTDSTTRELLQTRLGQCHEWMEEMKRKSHVNSALTPETLQMGYEMQVLEEILVRGEANPYLLGLRIKGEQKYFDPYSFAGACQKIDKYTKERQTLEDLINREEVRKSK